MDIDVLKAELTNDPKDRGYSGMNDMEAAVDLNTVYCSRDVESVTGQQIFEAVTQTDFTALFDAQKDLLYAIVGMGTILVNGVNTKAALLAMFGAGTQTRMNLAALQTEAISRGVKLELGIVREGNVQQARMI